MPTRIRAECQNHKMIPERQDYHREHPVGKITPRNGHRSWHLRDTVPLRQKIDLHDESAWKTTAGANEGELV